MSADHDEKTRRGNLVLGVLCGVGVALVWSGWAVATRFAVTRSFGPHDAVRAAKTLDIGVIVQFVNSAYRPKSGAYGWTHEGDLIAGARTNVNQIAEILSKPDSVVLLGLIRSETAACVHIERIGGDSHIGMLAVTPSHQDSGIGKELLAHAEHYARTMFRTDRFVMMVVSSRSELISFYQRRGYQRTGSVMPYPLLARAGTPIEAGLKIEILEKWAGSRQISTPIS